MAIDKAPSAEPPFKDSIRIDVRPRQPRLRPPGLVAAACPPSLPACEVPPRVTSGWMRRDARIGARGAGSLLTTSRVCRRRSGGFRARTWSCPFAEYVREEDRSRDRRLQADALSPRSTRTLSMAARS